MHARSTKNRFSVDGNEETYNIFFRNLTYFFLKNGDIYQDLSVSIVFRAIRKETQEEPQSGVMTSNGNSIFRTGPTSGFTDFELTFKT